MSNTFGDSLDFNDCKQVIKTSLAVSTKFRDDLTLRIKSLVEELLEQETDQKVNLIIYEGGRLNNASLIQA